MPKLFALFSLFVLAMGTGCHSVVHHGGFASLSAPDTRIYLPPFFNATDDEHAARALTELTATALLERKLPVIQTEPVLAKSRAENAPGADGLYLEGARALNATHLLIGTIHEYRYKTDLDGDPAVGLTLRLVDAQNGRTLWQGSSAQVGLLCASLTKASQKAVRSLVRKIPVDNQNPNPQLVSTLKPSSPNEPKVNP